MAEVIGSDEESRHWFEAEVAVRRESYWSPSLLPGRLNPFRFRAQRRANSLPDWTPELDIENPVHIFVHDQRLHDENGQIERVDDYYIYTVAKKRDEAREQVTAHLETGPFRQFDLSAPDPKDVEKLEEAPAVQEAKAEYRQFNPYVNGEYSPDLPEVHLLAITDTETISGVVWIRMNRAQMREEIARAQDFQQRDTEDGEAFWMNTMMNDTETERFMTILDSIDSDNQENWVCAPVSIANEPEVSVAVILNGDVVDRIRHAAGYPELQDNEMSIFGFPIPDFYLDEFIENAQTAVEMDSPAVAGMNLLQRD